MRRHVAAAAALLPEPLSRAKDLLILTVPQVPSTNLVKVSNPLDLAVSRVMEEIYQRHHNIDSTGFTLSGSMSG